ncbi:MAG: hypothetical protein FJY97_10135 [candidate division Zixibacteria bacterium]|nr:hypothetical protein [candidate division Zixibacteria bacterium]
MQKLLKTFLPSVLAGVSAQEVRDLMKSIALASTVIFACVFLVASCKKQATGPTLTNADTELFGPFVVASTEASQPAGSFDWGGTVLNRSKFTVSAAVKLELINPDNVVFYTTPEHLVEKNSLAQTIFQIKESSSQVRRLFFRRSKAGT